MNLVLTAEKRDTFGKGLIKAREAGKLPVVSYGPKDASETFFVDLKEFKKVFKEGGESSVVTLNLSSGNKDVLIKEVDFNPVSGEPVHADFYVIEKGKKVEVTISIVFVGESPAVKTLGGALVKVLHEVDIEAMPKDLPHEIEVDISALVDFDSRILVSDLPVAEGVEILADPEDVVALVSEVKEEEEEEIATDISSIEVEKKGKKEEDSEAEKSAE